jgi:hypothetical protein
MSNVPQCDNTIGVIWPGSFYHRARPCWLLVYVLEGCLVVIQTIAVILQPIECGTMENTLVWSLPKSLPFDHKCHGQWKLILLFANLSHVAVATQWKHPVFRDQILRPNYWIPRQSGRTLYFSSCRPFSDNEALIYARPLLAWLPSNPPPYYQPPFFLS